MKNKCTRCWTEDDLRMFEASDILPRFTMCEKCIRQVRKYLKKNVN